MSPSYHNIFTDCRKKICSRRKRIYVSCCTVYKRQKSWEMCVPFYIKLIATGKLDEDEVGQGSGMILYAGLIG